MIPHKEPFLFVDCVLELEQGRRIVAERRLRAEESYFAGHFPGAPLMPGVLVAEALAQASGLLLGAGHAGPPLTFHLAAVNVKFIRPAIPGETLTLVSVLDQSLGEVHRFQVEATVEGQPVARGMLTLARPAASQAPAP